MEISDSIKRETIENLLNMNDPEIKQLWMGWDKGDCSIVGLVRILMIQEINKHIKENGIYYDGMYDELLDSLYNKYNT